VQPLVHRGEGAGLQANPRYLDHDDIEATYYVRADDTSPAGVSWDELYRAGSSALTEHAGRIIAHLREHGAGQTG
jgi:hypothetical protein